MTFVASAMASLMMTALVGTAAAHDTSAHPGSDYAEVRYNHVEIRAHDRECTVPNNDHLLYPSINAMDNPRINAQGRAVT